MTYKETLEYLYNSTPVFEKVGASAYKEGLSGTIALDNHFGNPHKNFRTIHVAGTNGKGSCSHTLAAILRKEGYRVGLFTSPHIVDFRERIRVDGEMIPKDYVVRFVEEEKDFFEPLHPSFFELTTALAFKYFAEQKVDIAVIEVGLGGRLDCTNIITPELSIITNISFDHTQFLGDTLAKIAGEKAGIIKKGVPVVIGEAVEDTRPVFESKAKELEAPIVFAEDAPEVLGFMPDDASGTITYETATFGNFVGELGGIYQAKNANTVLTAVKVLQEAGLIKNQKSVVEGFGTVCEATGLVGRWQRIATHPLTICDTGHNLGGWQYLSKQIKAQPFAHKHIVFGMVDDKDLAHVLALLPADATFYWTQPDTHRAFPAEKVAAQAAAIGLQGKVYPSVPEAYQAAKQAAKGDDFIFVGGSSYVVSDLLLALSR